MTATSPLPTDEDREALARLIWEESIAFSNPRRPRATEWADIPVSAARQSARGIADAILAAGFRRSVVSTPDPDDAELIADAKALVESWDHRGSWSPESPVGMVARLAARLEASDALARRLFAENYQSAVSAPPTITEPARIALASRRGGKTQALIDAMLAQANERGIAVEILPPTITDEARARARDAVRKEMRSRTYDRHAYDDDVFEEGVADIADAALRAALGGEENTGE